MSRTLPLAREAFIAAISRDTSGDEVARLVGVLDALLAWSAARPTLLAFRANERGNQVLSFERVGPDAKTRAVFWSARVTRGVGPKLEIYPPAGRARSAEERASALETLNAHSREALVEGDRLRIGFSALKNANARAAVLALMDELLAPDTRPAEATR